MAEYRKPREYKIFDNYLHEKPEGAITQDDIDNFYAEQEEGAGFRYGDPTIQAWLASRAYGEPLPQMGPSLKNSPTTFERSLPYVQAVGGFARDMTGIPDINLGVDQMARGFYGETPRTADGDLARDPRTGDFLPPRQNPMMMANGVGNALLGSMMYTPIGYTRPLATMAAGFGLSSLDSTMPDYVPSPQDNQMLQEVRQTPRGTRYQNQSQGN